jgi:hypothetical protein
MPGSRTKSTVADGAAGKTKPSRAEPPAGSGAGQGGQGSRGAQTTSTYHHRQEADVGPGGRFANQEPRLSEAELPAPNWAPDLLGPEPPADRREDGPRINGFPLHEEWEP